MLGGVFYFEPPCICSPVIINCCVRVHCQTSMFVVFLGCCSFRAVFLRLIKRNKVEYQMRPNVRDLCGPESTKNRSAVRANLSHDKRRPQADAVSTTLICISYRETDVAGTGTGPDRTAAANRHLLFADVVVCRIVQSIFRPSIIVTCDYCCAAGLQASWVVS